MILLYVTCIDIVFNRLDKYNFKNQAHDNKSLVVSLTLMISITLIV